VHDQCSRTPEGILMTKLLSGRRVLVVEDEMLVLMDAEDMLTDLGCEQIVTAATVDQALALIDTQTFDVAMVDMNLNGVQTDAVADALVARGVPFVFATGYVSYDEGAEGGDYKDRPLLKKPFHLQEMSKILTCLLSLPT
jgi:CheY-like chemotaxis protein